jgi:hypothetical protein
MKLDSPFCNVSLLLCSKQELGKILKNIFLKIKNFLFLDRFNILISKIILKNKKILFPNKKYFKK